MRNITWHLKKGIEGAYFQNLNLKVSDGGFREKITEYLFTANIANELLKWRHGFWYRRFVIHVEYDADEFCTGAFSQFRLIRMCVGVSIWQTEMDDSISLFWKT